MVLVASTTKISFKAIDRLVAGQRSRRVAEASPGALPSEPRPASPGLVSRLALLLRQTPHRLGGAHLVLFRQIAPLIDAARAAPAARSNAGHAQGASPTRSRAKGTSVAVTASNPRRPRGAARVEKENSDLPARSSSAGADGYPAGGSRPRGSRRAPETTFSGGRLLVDGRSCRHHDGIGLSAEDSRGGCSSASPRSHAPPETAVSSVTPRRVPWTTRSRCWGVVPTPLPAIDGSGTDDSLPVIRNGTSDGGSDRR
jgi:hypothetical protein